MNIENKMILDLFQGIESWALIGCITFYLILTFLPKRSGTKEKEAQIFEEEEYQRYLVSSNHRKRCKLSFVVTLVAFIVVSSRYIVETIYGDGGDILFALVFLFLTWLDQRAYMQAKKLSKTKV